MKKLTLILTLLLSIVCLGSWAQTVVTTPKVSTTEAAYRYTLHCKAGDHNGYLGIANGSFNGRCAEADATEFVFEATGTDGQYYLRSVELGYVTANGGNITFTETPSTYWTINVGEGWVYLLANGVNAVYLNNNKTSGDGIKTANGTGDCSHWVLTEYETLAQPLTWSEVKNGATYAIVNVQPNKTGVHNWYLNSVDGNITPTDATGCSTITTWPLTAQFKAEAVAGGKYAFKNLATNQYLAYKSHNTGENGMKGLVDNIESYSSWTMNTSSRSGFENTYWPVCANRTASTVKASTLLIPNAGGWNAWGDTECTNDAYSNNFGFVLLAEPEVPSYTIHYNYIYDGNKIAEEDIDALEGSDYPAPNTMPYGLTYTLPEGTVTADDSQDITVSLADNYPFKYSTSYADATWYQLTIRNSYHVYYNAENGELNNTGVSGAAVNNETGYFAFIGTPFGTKIINKAAGADKAFNGTPNTNNSAITMGDYATGLDFVFENNSNHYVFSTVGNKVSHVNNVGGDARLGFWNVAASATDAGSTFIFTEVEEIDPTLTVTRINDISELTDGYYIIKNKNTADVARQGYTYMGSNYALLIQTDTTQVNVNTLTTDAVSADYVWHLTKDASGKWTIAGANGTGCYWPSVPGSGNMTASTTPALYELTNHTDGNGTISMKSGNFINSNKGYVSGWSNAHAMEFFRLEDVEAPVTLTYQLANGDVVATPIVNIPSCKAATDLTYKSNVPDGYAFGSRSGEVITVLPTLKNGQTYYIASDNRAAQYYLSYNGTGLGLSATKEKNTAQMWTCVRNGEYYTFRNVESGKWLSHKNVADNAYNFRIDPTQKINEGCLPLYAVADARYMLTKNDGTGFDQATGTYNKATTNYTSDYIFTECNPVDAFMSDSFEEATWIRLANANNTGYMMSGTQGKTNNGTAVSDASSANQLYAFVGSAAEGFYIYNKVLGENYTLTAANSNEGTVATWAQNAETPTKWYIIDTYANAAEKSGYVLALSADATRGLNMYGGAGGDTKFYGANDGGTHWKISIVDSNPTIIHYTVTGTKKYVNDANQWVGKLTISKGSFSSDSYVTEADNNTTFNAYLPKSSETISFKNYNLHGWKYEQTEQNGEYNITYTADEETNYQYLAFDKSAQWYRIPAIVSAKNGDIVSIYDYRVCHNDVGFGEVDQVMRRSSDFGQTWTAETKIADGNGGGKVFGAAFGDPALVADRESGKMTLITVSGTTVYTSATGTDHNLISVQFSDNNGATWSEPENITSQFWGAASGMFADADTEAASTTFAYSGFFGSGKILQSRVTKVGEYYRIYAAMLCRGKNVKGAYVVYSDDMGHNWKLLGGDNTVKAAEGSDEPKVEELPNGDIVLSCRKYNGRYFNIWKWSQLPEGEDKVGAGQWGTVVQSNQQTGGISVGGNSCNGEILYVKAKKADDTDAILMLQSLPSGNDRSGVEIWYKDITDPATYADVTTFASNWTRGLRVSPQSTEDGSFSAYSTMTIQQDGKIGFLYEEGPATYCIVYVPLTVEEITNNAYKGIAVALPTEEYIAAVAALKNAYAEKNVELGDGSSWLDYVASDAAALETAKTAAAPQIEKSAIELYNEPVTIEALQDMTDALTAISIVQKYKKGCYVRIKGYSNNYISLPATGNGKMSDAEDKTTVLYLAPTGEITSFATGLGLSQTSIASESGFSQFTLLKGAQEGKYYVKSNASGIGTYLYDNTANGTKVDRNGGPVTNGSYQTDWTLIEVATSEIANLSSEEVQNNSLAYGVAPMVEGDYIANIIEKTADGNVVKNLALTDKVDFDTPVEFTAVKAIYKRVTPEGEGWNTAVLPYAFEVPAGMTVLNNATKGANSISFDEVTAGSTVAANTPFLYRAASGEVITIEAADVDIAANVEALTSGDLCGTYTKIGQGDATGKLIMTQDGQGFKTASALASIPAFRAYLEGNGATSSNVYTITIGDDLTGVYDFNASNGINQKVDVYSVDGKIIRTQVDAITALQGLASGTYIVNGNKIKK